MDSYIKNYNFGIEEENKKKECLEKFFNCKLNHKINNRYCLYDYESECKNIYIEIKSRRNEKLKYETTMIGYNKIQYFYEKFKKNKKVYIVFNFTDCISYYQLKEIKKEYIQMFKRVKYYFIPTKELINIDF
jgi:KaiC/GvpD/RAD55 family RecA-like ATPase